MSNEVTPFSANAPVATDMVSAIAQRSREVVAGGNLAFLKLARDGEWLFGPEDNEVDVDDTFMIHPGTFRHGYCAWGDNKSPKEGVLCGELMVPINQATPTLASLEVIEFATWKAQSSMQLVCIDGPNKGAEMLYKISSVGGNRAFSKLCGEIAAQAETDPANIFPIVALDLDSYKHKTFGKIYVPVINVEGWSDGGEAPAAVPPKAAAPAPEKKKRQRRKRA